MPTTIIYEYEEVVEDREKFLHRSLWNWAHGRMPWSDGSEQRGEEEHRQHSRRHDEEVEPFYLTEGMEDREPRNGPEFPWLDEALDRMSEQRREDENRRQSRHEEEGEEPFRPPQAVQDNLMETTWAAAGGRLQAECAVCLKDFEAEDKVSTIIPCGHCFHQGCILPWLRVSCVCPLCRHALITTV